MNGLPYGYPKKIGFGYALSQVIQQSQQAQAAQTGSLAPSSNVVIPPPTPAQVANTISQVFGGTQIPTTALPGSVITPPPAPVVTVAAPATAPMSTGEKVAVGAAGIGVIGIIAWAVLK